MDYLHDFTVAVWALRWVLAAGALMFVAAIVATTGGQR